MAVISFNTITVTLLCAALLLTMASVTTKSWYGSGSLIFDFDNEGQQLLTKCFILLGIVSTAVALFIQLLITCSLRFAASRPVQLLCLFFVALATGSMLSGAIVYGVEYCESASRCGYSYWLSAIAAVLVFEATSTIKSSTRPVATVKPLVQQPVSHCSPRLQRHLNIQGGVVERLLRLVICVRGPGPRRKFF